MVVHQLGMPCEIEAIVRIARRHGLPVIEDAACAAGSELLANGNWERIGAPHGDVACFSFHPRKVMTTGDGGMLTTSHPEWDRQFRMWRQHSMSVPDTTRHASKRVVFEEYNEIGFNYRLTDLQAAIGRVQLQRLPGWSRAGASLPPGITSCSGSFPTCSCRSSPPGRAATGRATASGCPPAAISAASCRPCSTRASRPGAA
jgi:dTDP-4-amino-4,6-dideoxygalactose transaminase